jgi:DNA helicase II / ATP-dependent DNA helicase PcrA
VEEHLVGLNESQRRAVVHPKGPLLVLAGAGSGKTRVLTLRLAWLIRELGISPWRMLAVTFTNKAAGEMQERVRALLGDEVASPWVSTFHSACLRILRREVEHIEGIQSGFVIYDDDESRRLLKMLIEQENLAKAMNVRALAGAIDRAKNDALGPRELAAAERSDLDPRIPHLYGLYQERLRRANAMDFGDLILETIRLLERNEEVRDQYRRRFAHVLVDEYQDTNRAQYLVMKHLVDHGERNVCVVGDEDQSIYSFRGADIRNILDFERDFEGAEVVRLERNYRSTGTILDAATAVVEVNTERLGKKLWTDSGRGEKITLKVAFDDREEAVKALAIIRREMSKGIKPREIAVFYRTNAMSRLLEEEFIASRLPFVLVGGQRFYERREVKDALSYLKLVLNPNDDVALLRVLNEPARKIGNTTRKLITGLAIKDKISCWDALCSLVDDASTTGRVRKALTPFRDLVDALRVAARGLPLPMLLERVLDRSGIKAKYEAEDTFESKGRLENLEELGNSTADYAGDPPPEGLLRFLDRVSLVADTDSLADGAADDGRVTMMTVHAAKGLEFPVVLVVGMDEDIFPHFRANQADSELQEERRLAYVAITRAEQRLYLLRARRRRFNGEYRDMNESRFLRQIPRELLTGDVWMSSPLSSSQPAPPRPERPGDPYVVYDTAPGGGGQPFRSRFSKPRRPHSWQQPAGQKGLFERKPGPTEAVDEAPAAVDLDEPRVVRELDDEVGSMLKPGTRVLHPRYGQGEIRAVEGSPSSPRARIFFRKSGLKLVYLRNAELEILSS